MTEKINVGYVSIKRGEQTELSDYVDFNQSFKGKYTIQYDYPLSKVVYFEHEFDDSCIIRDLVSKICEDYHSIYKKEEETTNIRIIPMNERVGLINRNQTDGDYGIWGHDIDDLYLHTVNISEDNVISLGIDS